MNNESKLKIVLLGPVSSGKTTVANFLSNASENVMGEFRNTKGVRILEFIAQGVRGKAGYQNNVEVELWDCSGDNRYQSCWPAIQYKADGIVFIYNVSSNQQKSDLEMLYNFFVEESKFSEGCCLVLRNEFGSDNNWKTWENPLPSLTHLRVNLEEKSVEFKKNFFSFLSTIVKSSSKD